MSLTKILNRNSPCLPTKSLHNYCPRFLLEEGGDCNTQEKLEHRLCMIIIYSVYLCIYFVWGGGGGGEGGTRCIMVYVRMVKKAVVKKHSNLSK